MEALTHHWKWWNTNWKWPRYSWNYLIPKRHILELIFALTYKGGLDRSYSLTHLLQGLSGRSWFFGRNWWNFILLFPKTCEEPAQKKTWIQHHINNRKTWCHQGVRSCVSRDRSYIPLVADWSITCHGRDLGSSCRYQKSTDSHRQMTGQSTAS